jgi:hypothetical protein
MPNEYFNMPKPPREKHFKDVIKSQEEHLCGQCVDVALGLSHTNRVKRISWILRGEKAFLSR